MSDKPLRIMWMSNAPWVGTGYGIQCSKIVPYLKGRPEVDDVAIFCYYGIQGAKAKLPVGKYWIDCYPMGVDPGGNDVADEWVRDFKANILITLLDVFVVKPDFGSQGFYWLPYAPIDHDPMPEPFLERFRTAYRPIVYSQFAVKKCQEKGLECWYAPHGVETDIFKPRSAPYRRKVREWLHLKEDAFVVGVVAANKDPMDRKGFADMFDAFSQLLQRHSDCQMYMHTLYSPEYGGMDLINMAKSYGVADNVLFTKREVFFKGLTREELADVYQTFDVFLNPCHRAGFEIPLIEAQASGVPIIAGDWHSMTELCGAGWLIEPERRLWSPLGTWMYAPKIDSAVECLFAAYEQRGDSALAQKARDFAMEYSWERVLRHYWGPIIERLADELTIRHVQPGPAEEIRMTVEAVPFEGKVQEVVDAGL